MVANDKLPILILYRTVYLENYKTNIPPHLVGGTPRDLEFRHRRPEAVGVLVFVRPHGHDGHLGANADPGQRGVDADAGELHDMNVDLKEDWNFILLSRNNM